MHLPVHKTQRKKIKEKNTNQTNFNTIYVDISLKNKIYYIVIYIKKPARYNVCSMNINT